MSAIGGHWWYKYTADEKPRTVFDNNGTLVESGDIYPIPTVDFFNFVYSPPSGAYAAAVFEDDPGTPTIRLYDKSDGSIINTISSWPAAISAHHWSTMGGIKFLSDDEVLFIVEGYDINYDLVASYIVRITSFQGSETIAETQVDFVHIFPFGESFALSAGKDYLAVGYSATVGGDRVLRIYRTSDLGLEGSYTFPAGESLKDANWDPLNDRLFCSTGTTGNMAFAQDVYVIDNPASPTDISGSTIDVIKGASAISGPYGSFFPLNLSGICQLSSGSFGFGNGLVLFDSTTWAIINEYGSSAPNFDSKLEVEPASGIASSFNSSTEEVTFYDINSGALDTVGQITISQNANWRGGVTAVEPPPPPFWTQKKNASERLE